MPLLLVVVLLFFSSSCSVSSAQYYVSDDCSSVTQSPCNPLSVYAGNMSQYNNTIFYFIGTSVINFIVTMDSVQNITLHGLDQSPTIRCINDHQLKSYIRITTSSHVCFSNLSFQQCGIFFRHSSNITITGSIFKSQRWRSGLTNVFDSKITSSVFDNVVYIQYISPRVCYNELHHYSLTLTNVTVTNNKLSFDMHHGTSYNISVILDNVNIISSSMSGISYWFTISLFSLYITNSSVSNSEHGFYSRFYINLYFHGYKFCNIKGVESRSTVAIEDSQFYNNRIVALSFRILRNFFQTSNHHIDFTVKSCSIRDSDYGLLIAGGFSTLAHISVIDTELAGNKRNDIGGCLSILLNNVTVANSLSTGLVIIASVVTVENRLVFKNNTGVVGGGMAINSSSVVALSPSANLEFIDNHATYKGGGIYIDDKIKSDYNLYSVFYILPLPTLKTITFKGNTAGVAGNDMYGVDSKLQNAFSGVKELSTSSDASAFAFCDPDSNETTTIWYDDEQQSVFPGQPLKYNVALFGRSSDAYSYSVTDGRITIEINGTSVIDKYINNCSLIEYTPKFINYGEHNVSLTDTSYRIQLNISFILNECPFGFSVNSSGFCDCSVSRENVTCDINTLDITHNGLLWIGTYHTSTPFNANSTNPNACIINEDCLLYCSPNPVIFQFNHTDTQCVDDRGHRMCGSCTEGYSLLMGSNKCGHCHNNYMMIAWIGLFAVMGVLLVALLIALNLTVSVGTLNGLLFYANIVKLYEPVFSRKGALPVLSQVISWINLDFGFEICFYNGMDSYAKQWLQFAFPLYLWIIIIIIIQLCRRYGKISRLMGSHAVPVLSTLTFLSYTKLVRTIVIVLHKCEVTLHCTDESVRSVSLWYEDPNVEYAKGKHAGLFGFALLVSVFFIIPYTLFLLCHPVFEKYLSHFKLFKSWSRFKPIIDAYSGPMKDEYRFWPGLLLVTRIPVLLIVTFLKNESRVMLLTVAASILSFSFIFGGVYRRKLNNIIEFWFLFNLCIMASLSIAFTDENEVLIWYNTCLSVFAFSFILIVVYHLYLQLSYIKCYDALIKKLFKKQDEDHNPLDVTESHLTVDQQMREIVPSSTDVRLSDSRESVVDLFLT
uniref:Right handed beta helix domain-containing protein n=1 Tax=Amphimedon queenslandica TaxID=400682 RepID=A0A1X7U269_AMPQE